VQAIDPHFLDRFGEAYVREAQSWVAGLPSASGPTAWDGYTSLIVADACKRSFRSGAPRAGVPSPTALISTHRSNVPAFHKA